MSRIHQHRLENGAWLVAEPIGHVQSLSLTILVPAGVVNEPAGQQGATAVLAEMICRGAGDLDAKAHSDALDRLGVQRGTDPETHHLRIGATMMGDRLTEALPLLIDMVRHPLLTQSALEPSRDLALQALDALEDEPQQKVFLELKARHYAEPFGRSSLGRPRDLEVLTLEQVRSLWSKTFVPSGTVLGVSGRFEWPALKEQIEQLLADWDGSIDAPPPDRPGQRGYGHVMAHSEQIHIGLMYDAVPERDESSIYWHAMAAVLSGGMSGRLFTEVREKRGLCYAVSAAYAGHRDRGAMLGYAGTTAARAQETLDVFRHELVRLGDGIDENEFKRAIVGMKSRLVMQGESTVARARAIATDQYIYGYPRSLDEWSAQVDGIQIDALRCFVAENRPDPMTIVTIGPQSLNM